MTRPAHRDPALLLIVAVGGAVGATARYLLSTALPPVDGFPTATFVANLVGALALGALLEGLSRTGPETMRTKRVRLGLGTGVLGGFTTFSSLALETERLLAAGRVGLGLGYAVGSVVLGLVACVAGIALASGRRRRRGTRDVPCAAPKYPVRHRSSPPGGVPRGHTGYVAERRVIAAGTVASMGTPSVGAVVLLALAGGAGVAARFVVDGLVRARRATAFPFGTLVVNVSGSLAIGIVTGCVLAGNLDESWRLILATGFCGGYTTFSTATAESVTLARSGRVRLAVANSVGTLLLTVLAVAAGIGLVRVMSGW